MANERFLVTAALPYSNGRLHVGHIAGAYLPADTYVRYMRAMGREVRFVCGSDDNGVAALKTAREQGRTVEELTAHFNESQRNAFVGLGINFDIYGGTHQPGFDKIHERFSQDLFLNIHEKGLFTKRTDKQLFDTEANQFLPDRFVRGTCPHCGSEEAYGDQCSDCGRAVDQISLINPISTMSDSKPEPRDTTHWYLRLDQLQAKLSGWLASKKDPAQCGTHWRPGRVESVVGQDRGGRAARTCDDARLDLGRGLCRLMIRMLWASRCTSGLTRRSVMCRSPTSCASSSVTGEDAYRKWWKDPDCKIIHFIGEDNIVFHAITWPAMLLASHESDNVQGEAGEYQFAAQRGEQFVSQYQVSRQG